MYPTYVCVSVLPLISFFLFPSLTPPLKLEILSGYHQYQEPLWGLYEMHTHAEFLP